MHIHIHSKGLTIRVLFWLPIWIYYLWDSIMALVVTPSNVLLYQLLHRKHFWKVALYIQSSGKCKNAKRDKQVSLAKGIVPSQQVCLSYIEAKTRTNTDFLSVIKLTSIYTDYTSEGERRIREVGERFSSLWWLQKYPPQGSLGLWA